MIIGDEVHRRFQAGQGVDIRELGYALAEELFGSEDDGFADELSDRSFDLGKIVLWGPSDESGHISGTATDTIQIMDFGAGHTYLALTPNSDLGRERWEILREVDPNDREAIDALTFEDLHQYW